MIKHANNENFNELVGKGRVLVDFFATWCGPCKMLSLVIEKLDKKNVIPIIKVDVDECEEISGNLKIFSIPTLIIFENGKELKRKTGYMSLDELESWVNNE